MSSIDILDIDTKIRKELSSDKLDEYEKIKLKLLKSLEVTKRVKTRQIIHNEIKKIDQYIDNTSNQYNINFYINDTVQYIEEYKSILKIPKKINFMGKVIEDDDSVKNTLINKFLNASSKYTRMVYECVVIDLKCFECGAVLDCELLEDSMYICSQCSTQQGLSTLTSSFADTERINISSKYAYARKTHFRECIDQYHGKQNITIPIKLYTDLDTAFIFHGLLTGDENTPRQIRYKRITKKTIILFLKELGYARHYENINLIYSTITGTPLDDISHLVELILEDFDKLSELYDKNYSDINRKNFINTQYVLFQFLRKHGHDCDKEDFSNLKTVDRKFFHEDMIQRLFQDLGWNYVSIF
jgi:hypothetical protein